MNTIQINAYAKINPGLDVLCRRPDGYHEVKMIMQTIGLYDRLTFQKTNIAGISLQTNSRFLPTNDNNLICKAAKLFFEATGLEPNIKITLNKHIPIAAGMAGGSTDAAATLIALNNLFHTGLSEEQLREIGVKVGADVPFCLMQGTALSEGIGEKLTPLSPAPSAYCLIVKPPFSVSTKEVYENLKLDNAEHPNIDALLSAISSNDLTAFCANLGNLLESVTIAWHPEIQEIKDQMKELGALGTLMSGSGPTVFGLFDNKKAAEHAFYQFKVGAYGKQTFLTTFHNR